MKQTSVTDQEQQWACFDQSMMASFMTQYRFSRRHSKGEGRACRVGGHGRGGGQTAEAQELLRHPEQGRRSETTRLLRAAQTPVLHRPVLIVERTWTCVPFSAQGRMSAATRDRVFASESSRFRGCPLGSIQANESDITTEFDWVLLGKCLETIFLVYFVLAKDRSASPCFNTRYGFIRQ